MPSTAPCFVPSPPRMARLEQVFEELAELAGQRNAVDGRIVELVAELDRDGLWATTGARSVAALVAWKLGVSPRNAETIVAVAGRERELSRCVGGLREGRLSLDQVGAIAERAARGSDAHYAQLAASATVNQLRTAIKLEPPPPAPSAGDDDVDDEDVDGEAEDGLDADALGDEADDDSVEDDDAPPCPGPRLDPERSITSTSDEHYVYWKIKLPHAEAAKFTAALASHRDALVSDWKHDHLTDTPTDTGSTDDEGRVEGGDRVSAQAPPMPTTIDAFISVVEAGWDADATRRPHSHHSTVIVHLDIEHHTAALHLGPVLPDAERRLLLCDTTCELWLHRHGQPIGAGRTTRTISRRLRRALEHRDHSCVVPGCAATRGLHAHHLIHWEDGGPTELDNLVLVCPFHHRAHHRGTITLTGPAPTLRVTDATGRTLTPGSLARPPRANPPQVPPYPGPTGQRAQWWWYQPFQPPPPTTN